MDGMYGGEYESCGDDASMPTYRMLVVPFPRFMYKKKPIIIMEAMVEASFTKSRDGVVRKGESQNEGECSERREEICEGISQDCVECMQHHR